jgi:hypothetical protein
MPVYHPQIPLGLNWFRTQNGPPSSLESVMAVPNFEYGLKKNIVFSTLSHLGLMIGAVSVGFFGLPFFIYEPMLYLRLRSWGLFSL